MKINIPNTVYNTFNLETIEYPFKVGKYMMGYSDYGIVYDNENENLQLHRATRVNLTNNGD